MKRSIDRQLPEIYETLHCTFAHCWLKQCVPDIVIIIWPFITERCHIIRRWSHQGTMPSLRWFKVSLSKRGLFIFSIKNISMYTFVKWACLRASTFVGNILSVLKHRGQRCCRCSCIALVCAPKCKYAINESTSSFTLPLMNWPSPK